MHDQGQRCARRAGADDVVRFRAVEAQREPRGAGQELAGQHAHADQVGAVDALEALGHDRLDAGEAHALGRPVARAALAVVGAGDDDQRLAALHVGLDRFPHAHRLAFRLDAGQRALAHLALGIADHLVLQRRVGEGGALRGQVVAAVRGVGIEVLFRQAHLREVLAGRAVEQDRVRRREMIGGDVVAEDRQRAQAGERARLGQRALPIRRAADVGAHRAPVVQRLHRLAVLDHHAEHRLVHLAVLLRLHRRFHDGIDLRVRRPQILQQDRRAVGAMAQRVLLDVEAHGAGDGVGHHQRRRGEEGLLRVRVDAAVEVAIAREDRRRVQVAVDDLLLDRRIQRTAHAVAGGAGEGDDAEAQRFELRLQAGLFEVQRHGLRARRQRGLHPRLAHQAQRVRLLRQQAGGDDVARVRGVRAGGDRGDDHRAVRHQALRFLLACRGKIPGNALGGEVAGRDARMRVRGAGHRAHHGREVEVQRALVLGGLQVIGPEAGGLRVGLDQRHLLVGATGQAQVVERVAVDEEHRGGRAVLRRHVRDRRAVAERECRRAFAAELEVGPDHLRLAQELGEREHDVGGGDARLRLARQLDGDDVRQAHPRGAAQHHVLGLEAADADGDDAERIDVRRVRVGADAGVGVGHALLDTDHRRHLLQVDLVHDPVARRDHVDVLERALRPVDEVEAVFVATVFDGAVLLEGVRIEATALDGERVVDDQLHRHHRVHLRRIAAEIGDGIAQAGEVDERRLAEDVVADHARREPREVEVALALDELAQVVRDTRRLGAADDVLGVHARGVGQRGPGAGTDRIDGLAGVEIVEAGAGQRLAVGGVHGGRRLEAQAKPTIIDDPASRPGRTTPVQLSG